MANYTVTLTNGTGEQRMQAGAYSVSVTAAGYEATSLSPTTFTATGSAQSTAFTVTASGTLTFVVNETGAQGGTPITSGSLVMTNQDGSVQYGSPVTIGSDGTAVFDHVPYGSQESAYTLYFKQLSSDAEQQAQSGVISVQMNASTLTQYIQNQAYPVQSFTLTDATYSGLPVAAATMTFTANE